LGKTKQELWLTVMLGEGSNVTAVEKGRKEQNNENKQKQDKTS
jgi:hypothetical protein